MPTLFQSSKPAIATQLEAEAGVINTKFMTPLRTAQAIGAAGYATETYVNNAVSALVASAPGALDTLNELAAALGDDPNFATTIANMISGITSGTLDQFADVTQVATKTLAINESTILSGGDHSGTNTGDQDLSGYLALGDNSATVTGLYLSLYDSSTFANTMISLNGGMLEADNAVLLGTNFTIPYSAVSGAGSMITASTVDYMPVIGGNFTGPVTNSRTSVVSSPTMHYSGGWYSGGTATTTKPHFLIQPGGTISTGWSTAGTAFGINALSGFTGNLIDLQLNGTSYFKVGYNGTVTAPGHIISTFYGSLSATTGFYYYQLGVNALIGRATWYLGFTSEALGTIGGTLITLRRESNDALQINSSVAGTYRDLSARALYAWQGNYSATDYVRAKVYADVYDIYLTAETGGGGDDNINVNLVPTGTGRVKFGTHSAIGAETVTGYIEIKDSGGTTRKLAIVS